MSSGQLCNAKLKISKELNSINDIEVSCDKYHGHQGYHSKTFYHCSDREESKTFKDNHSLGEIIWKDELNK